MKPPQPIDEAELEQIERDLADSFEAFRLAEGAYMSGTPASSRIAASDFVTRILAFAKKENDTRTAQAVTAALKRLDEVLELTGNEPIKRLEPKDGEPLEVTYYQAAFREAIDQAHQAITNELSKFQEAS